MKSSLIRIILIGLFLTSGAMAKAQLSVEEYYTRCHEIQFDEKYFSAQGWDGNADKAYQAAFVELLEVINQVRRSEHMKDLRKNDIEMFIEKLYTSGDEYDILLYVPKDKVMAIDSTQNVTGQSQSQSGTSSQSSISSVTFIADNDEYLNRSYEIQSDENYLTASGVDDNEDKAYQAAIVELLEVINQLRRNTNMKDLRKNDIEKFINKLYTKGDGYDILLYVPKDKIMAIGTQNITGQSQSQSGTSSQSSTSSETFIEQRAPVDFDPNDIIQTICNQDTYIEIKGFIERWKQEGKIVFSGMTKNPAEVPADANAIVIGDRYKILAVLSPKNKSYRIDYKTGDEDDESKHPDFKFIVWYRTNNSK